MFQISENMRITLALIGQQRRGQAQIHQAEVRPPQAEPLPLLQDLAQVRLLQVQRQLQLLLVLV